MRKTAKRIVSAVIAVASVMSVALTASAVDYSPAVTPPSYSSTAVVGVSTSTPEVKKVVASDVSSSSMKVESTANLKLTADAVKSLAKKDNKVLEIVAPKVTISIDSAKITRVKTLNLSTKVTNSKTRTKVVIGKKTSFGCEVKLTITDCKMSAAKLKNAHWYLNGKDMGQVTLNDDNQPVITLTSGGEIVIK